MYGICFFNVAQMPIATLLETHFLEAKVSVDSHSQDTIRTDTTFLQLWLCNTSVQSRPLGVANGATAPGPALQAYGRPYKFVKLYSLYSSL
jgi:hypothetical protein